MRPIVLPCLGVNQENAYGRNCWITGHGSRADFSSGDINADVCSGSSRLHRQRWASRRVATCAVFSWLFCAAVRFDISEPPTAAEARSWTATDLVLPVR